MVKLPSLDDLKKAGAGLVDQAKAANISGVVDKLKTGIESVSGKKEAPTESGSADPVTARLESLTVRLYEVTASQQEQNAKFKVMEADLAELKKLLVKPEEPKQ